MDEQSGVERSEVLHTAHRVAMIAVVAMIVFVALALLFPSPSPPRRSPRAKCVNNLMQLHTAVSQYRSDHQGRFPVPRRWFDETFPDYVTVCATFTCPLAPGDRPLTCENLTPTYAMNGLLEGLREEDVEMPDRTVLFFESIPGRDLSGGPELFPARPRHKDGHKVVFVDGRVEDVPPSRVLLLNWWPKYKAPGYKPPKER